MPQRTRHAAQGDSPRRAGRAVKDTCRGPQGRLIGAEPAGYLIED